MKKLISICILVVGCLAFIKCDGDPLSKVEGRWKLSLPNQTSIVIQINDDGTGNFCLSGKDYRGKEQLIIPPTDVMLRCEGNDLYFTVEGSDGQGGHLEIRDDQLYSDTGEPFTKIK